MSCQHFVDTVSIEHILQRFRVDKGKSAKYTTKLIQTYTNANFQDKKEFLSHFYFRAYAPVLYYNTINTKFHHRDN